MGKRTEKALKEKAAASSSSQETTDDDANKAPEPYTCTGLLDADFTELCRRAGFSATEIPPVILRAKRPGTPPPPDPKAKDPTPPEEPVEEEEEPKPKTYVTKEKFAYFKPCIQVEMEHEDKPATVTEIYIRGWKIDDMMVGIFKSCFPVMEKLHTINFWNTGLTDKTMRDLALFFPQCANLKNITIEGNPIAEEPWACLIGEDSLVVNLSLRHNEMTDRGAAGIGAAISTVTTCNKNLISLNISHNKITDIGASAIARGLRMNRVILCLSLASNKITDKGAIEFGEVLSRFPLTHPEVVERRKLMRDKGSPDRGSGKSPPPSRRAESKDRPGSVRSGSHLDKGDKKRDKSSKKKDIKHEKKNEKEDAGKGNKTVVIVTDNKKDKDDKGGTKKDDKWKKGGGSRPSIVSLPTETVTKTTKGKKTTSSSSKDKKGGALPESESPDMVEAINPLLESVESIDGQLWIPGNRSIISFNLSRNEIREAGLKAMLLAVQYQITLSNLAPSPSLKGLMRLSLGRNPIRADSEAYQKLQDLLLTRDPFYKAQTKSPDGDSQSLAG